MLALIGPQTFNRPYKGQWKNDTQSQLTCSAKSLCSAVILNTSEEQLGDSKHYILYMWMNESWSWSTDGNHPELPVCLQSRIIHLLTKHPGNCSSVCFHNREHECETWDWSALYEQRPQICCWMFHGQDALKGREVLPCILAYTSLSICVCVCDRTWTWLRSQVVFDRKLKLWFLYNKEGDTSHSTTPQPQTTTMTCKRQPTL